MDWYFIVLIIVLSILFLILLTSFICYLMPFYNRNKQVLSDEIVLPDNILYKIYHDTIINHIENGRQVESKEYFIKSYDNLTLYGKFYKSFENAPIEIMFHGYRGSGERDLSTGIIRAKACGRNVLIVDQRAHGKSEGHTISFGIKERFDCLSWINFAIEEFGSDVKIILTGISMGAATVMMASNLSLPKNVIGILADCGYDSPRNIIKKYIYDMKLPGNLLIPFVKLGGLIFGHFNLDSTTALECVKESKVPIIFIHGECDTFVPCYMSTNLYNACTNKKHLVIVKNAEHGVSYLEDPETYVNELNNFFKN